MNRTLRIPAVLIAVAAGLAACGGPAPESGPTAEAPAASQTKAPKTKTQAKKTESGTTSSGKHAAPKHPKARQDVKFVDVSGGTATTSYAELVDVRRTGSGWTVRYDKVDMLTGAAAEKYYAAHPDEEPLDFAISNVNPRIRQVRTVPEPDFLGNALLGPGGSKNRRITGDQLAARLAEYPRTLVKISEQNLDRPEIFRIAEVYLP